MSRERTPASEWRVAVGRQLGALYAAQPNVAAMLIGGSAARGLSDGYSDLELGIFWHTPPTDVERQAVPTAAGADHIQLYPYDAGLELWEDTYLVGRAASDQPDTGLLCEVEHYTVATTERILDDVLLRYSTDDVAHSLLSVFAVAIPVHGAEQIARWRERAAQYPDALAVKLIRQYGQIEFFWRIEMLLARGNNLLMVYSELNRMAGQMLRRLLALNRQYYSGFKWLDCILDSLPLKPVNCGARLRQVFAGDVLAGSAGLAALIEETYDLVEAEFPTVDVAQLRRWFRWRRPFWEEPPPDLPLNVEDC